MEINLNNRMSAELGVGRGMPDAQGVGAKNEASGSSRASRTQSEITISHAVASPEDIQAAAIPESALKRDDALGDLIGRAFNLPPPPMPNMVD